MGILAYLIAGVALVGALGGLYWRIDSNGFERGKSEVQALWDSANEAQRQKEAKASADAAKALAEERAKRKVVIKERTVYVDREIEKPIYRDVCLPAGGVCLANAALLGEKPDRCKPDGTLPPTDRPR